jgi:hypothetical protein
MTLLGGSPDTSAVLTAHGPPARGRSRRLVLLGSVVLAVAATITAVALTGAEAPSTGPLSTDDDPDVNVVIGMPSLHVGQSFCYGAVIISNQSAHPATLDAVHVHGGVGLTVGTARVLGDRDDTTATAEACPLNSRPLRGYVVPPGAGRVNGHPGIELLLPIRIDRPGKSRIDRISLTYRVAGKSYTVDDVNDVVACTYDCE